MCAVKRLVLCGLVLVLSHALVSAAATNLLRNSSFESGAGKPDCWASFGFGRLGWDYGGPEGNRCISITGNGMDDSWWYARRWSKVEYNTLYRVSYWVRRNGNPYQGLVTAGLNLARRRVEAGDTWQRQHFFVRSPDYLPGVQFRLSAQRTNGAVMFDRVEMHPAVALHRSRGLGRWVLGDGETVRDSRYTAVHDMSGGHSNDCRFLVSYTGEFDQDRWVLNDMDEVVYKHEAGRWGIPEHWPRLKADPLTEYILGPFSKDPGNVARSPIQDGISIEVEVARLDLPLEVQVGFSGKEPWYVIGLVKKPGLSTFTVPRKMGQRREMYVRLKSRGARRIEIKGYRYSSKLMMSEWHAPVAGESHYLAVIEQSPQLGYEVADVGELIPGGRSEVKLLLASKGPRRRVATSVLVHKGTELVSRSEQVVWMDNRSTRMVVVPYTVGEGDQTMEIMCRDDETGETLLLLEEPFTPTPTAASREDQIGIPSERTLK